MQSIAHEKKVLLLRMVGGGYVVCSEFYETDNGRVHMLGDNRYAHFSYSTFVLEESKAARDVSSVIYSGTEWPPGVDDPNSRASVLAYFGCPDV